jgi:hypothetical protein
MSSSRRWATGSQVRIGTTFDTSRGRTDGHTFGCIRATRHGTHDGGAPTFKALEDAPNSRLFRKNSTGHGLTDASERLIARAEAIESAYVFTKAAASRGGQPISGTVRIGASNGFGNVFLVPRVRVPHQPPSQARSRDFSQRRADQPVEMRPISQSAIRTRQRSALCRGASPIRMYVASRVYLEDAPGGCLLGSWAAVHHTARMLQHCLTKQTACRRDCRPLECQ